MNDEPLPTLPHYVRPGLRLVFIGFNPGIESARLGHYYAFRRNPFWRHLSECGLVSQPVTFLDDATLMDAEGIGLTDLCALPTVKASELSREQIAEGARNLEIELRAAAPAVACFSGKGAWEGFATEVLGLPRSEAATRPFGLQPERIGQTTAIWIIPNSSGLAAGLHGRRVELLRELAAQLGH